MITLTKNKITPVRPKIRGILLTVVQAYAWEYTSNEVWKNVKTYFDLFIDKIFIDIRHEHGLTFININDYINKK